MRATIMYRAGDVRVRMCRTPELKIQPMRSCASPAGWICGSDLWPYKDMEPSPKGRAMGDEAIGVVEAVGAEVRRIKKGDFVVMPFAFSDGSCEFCQKVCEPLRSRRILWLYARCWRGTSRGHPHSVCRWTTLFALPVSEDNALAASLLTLSDVMGTGHHAAVAARVSRGKKVAVVGDGAVGLCGVIAAKRLGAEQIILLGRHPDRIALAKEFGATDIVSERGDEGAEQVRKITGGFGVHSVLESVGTEQSMLMAVNIARPGGAVGRVGVPHYPGVPVWEPTFYKTLRSVAGLRPSVPTSTNCCPMCSKGAFSRAGSLTESSASTKCRTAIAQ